MSTTQNNGCKWCERRGLPILPLRLAYVPNGDTSLTDGLKNRDGLITSLKSGTYMLRTITTGYVYTYQKVGGEDYWRCFAATDDGLFRELVLSRPPTEKPAFTCQLSGHALDASMISIENANEVSQAWVGYSPVWLTGKARKHLQKIPALWKAMMNEIAPDSLVKGGAVPADQGFRVTDEATLTDRVMEYGSPAKATFYYENTGQPEALDRSAAAKKLVQRATQKSPQGLVVLALNDVVGQMADVAVWRNLRVKRQAEFQNKEAATRGFATRQIILSIRDSIKNSDEPELWNERYRDKLDIARLEADDKTYQQKTTALQNEVEEASDDWLTFAQHPTLAPIWQLYDGEDSRVGQQLEADIAACYEGMGATEAEKDWLEAWLLDAADQENHPLWRALSAGNKEVSAFLKGEAEGVLGIFDQGISAAGKMKDWLDEHAKKANAKTPVPPPKDVTGSLSLSVMSLLPRLMKKHPQEAKLISVRLHMVHMIRADVVLYPHRFEVSAFELIKATYEMVWGDPKTGVPEYVRRGQASLLKQQTVRGGFLPSGSRYVVHSPVFVDLFIGEEAFRIVEGEAARQAEATQRSLPASSASTTEVVVSPKGFGGANPYKVSLADVRAASKEMVGLSGALALWSFVSGLDALDRADTGGKYVEAGLQLTSGVTAATSIVGETIATTLQKKAVDEIKIKAFARVGAIFSAVTGVVDATQYWLKARERNKEGDTDARNNYYAAVGFAAASGIAGAGGVLATAAGFGGGNAVFLGLGPIAWGVLAIGAAVASIYFLYQALKSEDTPLEIWMLKSIYRSPASKQDEYPNAKLEMDGFHLAVYGLHVEYTWSNEPGRDRISLRVMMPGFDKKSGYAYSLKAIAKKGKGEDLIIANKASPLNNSSKPNPRTQSLMAFKAAPKQTLLQKMGDKIENATHGTNFQKGLRYVREMDQPIRFISDIPEDFIKFTRSSSGAVLETTFLIDEDVFEHSTLQFEYWPDPINQPEIKMSLKASEEAIKKEGFGSYVF